MGDGEKGSKLQEGTFYPDVMTHNLRELSGRLLIFGFTSHCHPHNCIAIINLVIIIIGIIEIIIVIII